MSAPRPKRESSERKREGNLMSTSGRYEGESLIAQREGSPRSVPGRPRVLSPTARSAASSLLSAGAGSLLQVARFLLVGVANTLVGLAVIFAAKALAGAGDLAANASGYAVGLTLSFALNRSWTFRDRGRLSPAALRFMLAFALAYLANLATVFGLRDLAGVDSYVAQAAGVVPYTALFFLASRAFVFREHRQDAVSRSRSTERR